MGKHDSTTNIEASLASYERIIKAATTMTDDEKKALAEWEEANLAGAGQLATSDWPGWNAIINRTSH
ncbi:hypothetical protein OD776_28400 [Pseudomonas aeruginosa]|uniref:hypothetical protein n=1 Tax=Pseudomonas aeruginosa TaxID=287 RepID=UPI0021F0B392|nr:hypothetical protein [Pseudomonas aeruginosa]MCV4039537.1 hypothetical protein [Pseudomonas aeruginosa]HBO7954679.1 hypothetical protein [Pseudomonas aeruginosa]HBO7974803.1 hypothetical protein [Pseudomonas aeruginosa]HBO8747379.1 hypothetical protein [Pseudomonas aeruginosa]